MSTDPPRPHHPNPGFRCDDEQYARLKTCAEKQDTTEWNNWRANNPDIEIWLEGSTGPGMTLQGAVFQFRSLKGVNLHSANLAGSHFYRCSLEDADLSYADLTGADLRAANLRSASLHGVRMRAANANAADFEAAKFYCFSPFASHLEGTSFVGANFRKANLGNSHLGGADLSCTDLRGADAKCAAVDGGTMVWGCEVDEDTDFTGVGLDSARVEPGLKVLLEYYTRRRRWREWYRQGSWLHRTLKHTLVQGFWWMSDYGRSTGRILGMFLGVALLFATMYYVSCLVYSPGILANLAEADGVLVPPDVMPVRAVYMSIASMTGLGDLQPNADCVLSYVLVTIHVVLGYILLAALVTRLAILFTASGPVSRWTRQKELAKGSSP